jgi:hypothetical protein
MFKKLYQKLDEVIYLLQSIRNLLVHVVSNTGEVASCVERDEHKIKTKRQTVRKN